MANDWRTLCNSHTYMSAASDSLLQAMTMALHGHEISASVHYDNMMDSLTKAVNKLGFVITPVIAPAVNAPPPATSEAA